MQNEKTVNPTKTCVPKTLHIQKNLHTQNRCCKFIKDLLPEKCKENM